MLTDSAEPSSSRMKPCCLPNWAGTGSTTCCQREASSACRSPRSWPSSRSWRPPRASRDCLRILRAQGRLRAAQEASFFSAWLSSCRHGHSVAPCGTLRRMRSLMPSSYRTLTLRVPQSHTAKHLQCLRLPFLESPSRRVHLPESKSGPRSEGLRTRKADENVEG